MKYVMFETKQGHRLPVFFPDAITHSQVTVEEMKPVSAGFFDPSQGKPYGHSTSLKMGSTLDDKLILIAAFTNNTAVLTMLNWDRQEELKA